jgi:hypothetical protein
MSGGARRASRNPFVNQVSFFSATQKAKNNKWIPSHFRIPSELFCKSPYKSKSLLL